jgi:ribosomal protein S18 acetylase RimI-like enzyme
MIQFYKATTNDIGDLLRLMVDFEIEKRLLFEKDSKIDEKKITKEKRKDLKQFLKDDSFSFIISKQNNQPNGYIFLSYADFYEGEGYINEIYIIPTLRNKNIGGRLLAKGIIWLKQNNCTTIDITVNRRNKAAMSFYKKYGFGVYKDNYIPMRKLI